MVETPRSASEPSARYSTSIGGYDTGTHPGLRSRVFQATTEAAASRDLTSKHYHQEVLSAGNALDPNTSFELLEISENQIDNYITPTVSNQVMTVGRDINARHSSSDVAWNGSSDHLLLYSNVHLEYQIFISVFVKDGQFLFQAVDRENQKLLESSLQSLNQKHKTNMFSKGKSL